MAHTLAGRGIALLCIFTMTIECILCTTVSVRLTDNFGREQSDAGFVEISVNGKKWQRLCPFVLGDWEIGSVVCRQLNLGPPIISQFTSDFSESYSDRGSYRSMSCSGTESSLSECTRSTFGCSSDPLEFLEVQCLPPSANEFEVAIAREHKYDASQGIVLAFVDGRWGPICESESRSVVCHQLGFDSSSILPPLVLFVDIYASPVLDDFVCSYTARQIIDCSYRKLLSHQQCNPNSYLEVSCTGEDRGVIPDYDGDDPTTMVRLTDNFRRVQTDAGFVEVSINGGRWRRMCSAFNYLEWEVGSVVCRELGLGPPIVSKGTSDFTAVENELYLSTSSLLSCDGKENSLSECINLISPDHFECQDPSYIEVQCLPFSAQEFEVALATADKGDTEGIVLTYLDGRWGPICDSESKDTVCQQLGFENADDFAFVFGVEVLEEPVLQDLSCSGSEDRINQCGYGRLDAGEECPVPYSYLAVSCNKSANHGRQGHSRAVTIIAALIIAVGVRVV